VVRVFMCVHVFMYVCPCLHGMCDSSQLLQLLRLPQRPCRPGGECVHVFTACVHGMFMGLACWAFGAVLWWPSTHTPFTSLPTLYCTALYRPVQVGYMGVPYNGSPMAQHPQYITVRNSRGREMLDALGADLIRTPPVDTGDRRPLVMQVSVGDLWVPFWFLIAGRGIKLDTHPPPLTRETGGRLSCRSVLVIYGFHLGFLWQGR
jgi:hypothetical protein